MKITKQILIGAFVVCLLALPVRAAEIPGYAGDQPTPSATQGDIPLNRSNIEVTALSAWIGDTVSNALTLSPDSYEDQLKKISDNFTKPGWEKFTNFLEKSNIIPSIKENNGDIAIVPSNPIIVSEGENEGVYQWSITMAVRISYIQNEGKDENNVPTTLNIIVKRVPKNANVLGIQIDDWNQQ